MIAQRCAAAHLIVSAARGDGGVARLVAGLGGHVVGAQELTLFILGSR